MFFLRKTLLALSDNVHLKRFIMLHPLSRRVTRRFIAGETLDEAVHAVTKLNGNGLTATFDYLGENVIRKEDAEEAVAMYLQILETIEKTGIQANISMKLTELGLDFKGTFCAEKLELILKRASLGNHFIRIDMEGSPYTEKTLTLFRQVYSHYKNVGVVVQAYLYRSEKDTEDLISLGARVRLCKGAYNEPPQIAFPKKSDVDENYLRLMKKLLLQGNYPAIATHDPKIIDETKSFARNNGIDSSRFEFQMLYGIRRDLQELLVKQGYRVRIYVPYGKEWYPYFMRRLAERPANVLFFLSSLLKG